MAMMGGWPYTAPRDGLYPHPTLALPKTGLRPISGDLHLGDIGIPPEVYQALGLSFVWPCMDRYCIRLNV